MKAKIDKNKKIGLALGGGAVLGAAHIGVLKAIEELEIKISYVSGTSIGAIVGALFAFEKDYEKVEDLALDLQWSDIARFTISKFGLFTNNKIKNLITKNIGDVTFEKAKIPLAVVAANISNGDKVILKKGSVAEAVMASTCIPGVFEPVEIDDALLVDGGIVENVPVSPLKEMGAEVILAIDLNAKHSYGKPNNIIEVLTNSFHYTLANSTKLQSKDADVLIKPDLSNFNRVDMNQTKDLIEAGYKETMEILSK